MIQTITKTNMQAELHSIVIKLTKFVVTVKLLVSKLVPSSLARYDSIFSKPSNIPLLTGGLLDDKTLSLLPTYILQPTSFPTIHQEDVSTLSSLSHWIFNESKKHWICFLDLYYWIEWRKTSPTMGLFMGC